MTLSKHHADKVRARGFSDAHIQQLAQRNGRPPILESLTAEQIQSDWLDLFPRMKGNPEGALLLRFNDSTCSLKPDKPEWDPKRQRFAKYLYAKRPDHKPEGSNTQPWVPSNSKPAISTEGLFDALACTALIGIPCAAATAPSHIKWSNFPESVKAHVNDADVPFHHSPSLLPVVIGQAKEKGLKLAHLPRNPAADYAYTDSRIPEDCKWGMEEWHREWKSQGLDPKAELQKVIDAAVPPFEYLRQIITKDFKAAGIRYPANAVVIEIASRAIADATNKQTERMVLRDLLADVTGAGKKWIVSHVEARDASIRKKHLKQLQQQREQQQTLSGEDDAELPPMEEVDPSELTDDDLSQAFTAIAEDEFLNGEERWISVGAQFYRWSHDHYEKVAGSELKRRLAMLAKQKTKLLAFSDGTTKTIHPYIKPRFIEEALKWLQLNTAVDAEQLNPSGLINCFNGVLRIDWQDKKPVPVLEEHDPSRHYFIDPPGSFYNPDASPEDADRLLQCLKPESRQLFLEVTGACLDIQAVRRFGHRVPGLLLIGQGENGKDTLAVSVGLLHGRSSIANISLKDWQQYDAGQGRGRFSVAQLDRARLSICSENSGAFKLDNIESIKAAITGDQLLIERKGQDGGIINPKAAFLFFLNQQPLLDGGSAAILSRWGVGFMPYSFSTNPREGQLKADPRFKHDPEWLATNVLPALLNKMIEAMGDAVANGFSLKACSDDLQQLREGTSHLHTFLREYGYRVGGPKDAVELKQLWGDLQEWYRQEEWIELNRSGDWVYVGGKDGDKPVEAMRLLPKRLMSLHPTLRKERQTDKARSTLIRGLTKTGAK